ncbi:uncharacterized protein MEPE_06240 [Melanopsichium pennsylvanicum]|uniref:Uncharacterized protein n=2 Tax=Melanopsichium pennsylvanicum TaxID=63383 RepID=A0AAJ4XRI1_9BASI|nr:uncharacterized protein BN887_06226 [Melanopsichium pennsylvanicum 4]SNX87530.1 uncharacterized protein MEPE_06240 [Melanopsichium pennsylvanicum]
MVGSGGEEDGNTDRQVKQSAAHWWTLCKPQTRRLSAASATPKAHYESHILAVRANGQFLKVELHSHELKLQKSAGSTSAKNRCLGSESAWHTQRWQARTWPNEQKSSPLVPADVEPEEIAKAALR